VEIEQGNRQSTSIITHTKTNRKVLKTHKKLRP